MPLSLAAQNPNVHDDLTDALSLAITAVPPTLTLGQPSAQVVDDTWLMTPGGVQVPLNPRPRHGALRSGSSRLYSW